MDERGFYGEPGQLVCQRCSRGIDRDGNHPAQRYAGTYTGLCETCVVAPAMLAETLYDGAQVWDWPPHCPAWRTDRQKFIAYPGCAECRGHGRMVVSRHDAHGGDYPYNCRSCLLRYAAASERVVYQESAREHQRLWEERYRNYHGWGEKSRTRALCVLPEREAIEWFRYLMEEEAPQVPPGVFPLRN